MLLLDEAWKKARYMVHYKNAEYRRMDFYGPFLELRIERYAEKYLVVYPLSVKIETTEVSAYHFELLVEASKELYDELGKFILCLPRHRIEIKIDSSNTNELIAKGLKRIQLF